MKSSTESAAKTGKKDGRLLIEILKDLSPKSLSDLSNKIAVRHPRSRLRNLTECDVGDADTKAILDAMEIEAQLHHINMAEAGRMLLALLDAWDAIPREKWQYAAAIPKFFKQGDYRLQPKELLRSDR